MNDPLCHDLTAFIVGMIVVEFTLSAAPDVPSAMGTGIVPHHFVLQGKFFLAKDTLTHFISSWQNKLIFDNFSMVNYYFRMDRKALYTTFDHTADLGIIVTGTDLKDLFEKAAQSIIDIMFRKRPLNGIESIKVSLDGEDLADLMVRWLGEILYLFDAEQKIVSGIRIVKVKRTHLEAILDVAVFHPDHHEIATEIKAVTYHQIQVTQKPDGWSTRVIFDL